MTLCDLLSFAASSINQRGISPLYEIILVYIFGQNLLTLDGDLMLIIP